MKSEFKGLYRRGKIFWWRYTDASGLRHFKSLETMDKAQAIRTILDLRAQPGLMDLGAWRLEVRAYITEKRARRELSASYAQSREYVLLDFAKRFGIESPQEVTATLLQQWYHNVCAGEEGAPGKEETARHYVRHVRAFLDWLKKRDRIRENPAVKVQFAPAMRTVRKVFILQSQVNGLIEAAEQIKGADERKELLFVLHAIFNAGLRRNEVSEARTEWFQLAHGFVDIDKTPTFEPKDRDRRQVPLRRAFLDFLKAHEWPGEFMLRPEKKHGKARYRYDFIKRWKAFMKEHDLSQVTIHDGRRSFGSNLVIAGKPLYKVGKWLGDHPDVVERRYAHLAPRDEDIEI